MVTHVKFFNTVLIFTIALTLFAVNSVGAGNPGKNIKEPTETGATSGQESTTQDKDSKNNDSIGSPKMFSVGHLKDFYSSIWFGVAKTNAKGQGFDTAVGVFNTYWAQLFPSPFGKDDHELEERSIIPPKLFGIFEGNLRLTNVDETNDKDKIIWGAQQVAFDASFYIPWYVTPSYNVFHVLRGNIKNDDDLKQITRSYKKRSPRIPFNLPSPDKFKEIHGYKNNADKLKNLGYEKIKFINDEAEKSLNDFTFGPVFTGGGMYQKDDVNMAFYYGGGVRFQHGLGTYTDVMKVYVDGTDDFNALMVRAQALLVSKSIVGVVLGGSLVAADEQDEASVYFGLTIDLDGLIGFFSKIMKSDKSAPKPQGEGAAVESE